MSHEEEEFIIIFTSIALDKDACLALDNLVDTGHFGSTQEECLHHLLCNRLGMDTLKSFHAVQSKEKAAPRPRRARAKPKDQGAS